MIQIETRKGPKAEEAWLLISVESALYILIVVIAAALRLSGLGAWPLLRGEAAQAWGAWELLHGTSPESLSYSPLLFVLTLFNIFAFGASDVTVRLWPAFLGTAMVLLPLLLRDKLGKAGALAASFLLAVSPTMVYFSRTLDGAIVAAAFALAMLAFAQRYVVTRQRGYILAGAVALALGLMSGPTFYTFALSVLAFGLYLAWERSRDPGNAVAEPLRAAWQDLALEKGSLRRAAILILALILVVGSAFFLNPGGWQATLNVLGRWLGQFAPDQGGQAWHYYLRLMAGYESLSLILGVAGAVLAFRDRGWMTRFLAVWAIVALLVHSLAPQRDPGYLLIILVPLLLLGARAVERLAAWIHEGNIDTYSWLFLVVAAILFTYLYLQLVGFSFAGDTRYQALAIIAVIGLAVCFGVFWYWVGSMQALPVGVVALLLLFLVLQLHTLVELNYYNARDSREFVNISPTTTDIFNLPPFLTEISSRYTLDRHVMSVVVEEQLKPIVSWYTREFVNLRFANSIGPSPSERAVIMLAVDQEGPAEYIGQRFRLYEHGRAGGLGWGDWLKWYLRRFAIGETTNTEIEVWIRANS